MLSLTVGAILARLLEPSDYGLLMMAVVVSGLFAMASDLGLAAAVVQKHDLTDKEMTSVFWCNFGVAATIAAVLAAVSPLVADFYGRREVRGILCALALAFPIGASAAVQNALLQRSLQFALITRVQIAGSLLASLMALAAAWTGWGVWALVLQTLMVGLMGTLGLWWVSPWRPSWHFAWKDLDRIWGFSLNLTGFQLVNYLIRRADSFLIGRFIGPGPLGYYNLAYTFMLYPISNLTSVAQGVLVPAMSQVQTEPQRVARAYIRACRLLAFLVLPAMVGLALVASEVVVTIYGLKWERAGQVLGILSWVGTFQPFDSLLGTVFIARGFTQWFFRWAIVVCFVTVTGFLIGLPWGVEGVATGYLVSQILVTVFGFPLQCRKTEVPLQNLLRVLAVPALASAGMGACVFGLKVFMARSGLHTPLIVLAICVPAGVAGYLIILWFLRGHFWADLRSELGRMRGPSRSNASALEGIDEPAS